ncbi:autotransporter domain-containing protein [Martelella lutilitoris]|uniref:Autotransporter domain-containing protein n=1 Tax=Martelella lutilitoris TaxID=2583532 RepID=A0A7T7HIY5_9HYPH|nr:autotransporter domain-containing protein [Martelella lutilitoris]QQM30060.1 autotransporter domain-containing protein [Martelella lutilitoris]
MIALQSGSITGKFADTVNDFVTKGGQALSPSDYLISYNGGDGNDLTIIVYGAPAGPFTFWNGGTGSNLAVSGGAGGNGTWNAGNTNWVNDGPNPSTGTWTANETAVFGGNSGTVTVASNVSVDGIEFRTGNYVLTSSGSAITLASQGAGDVVIDVSGRNVIDVPLLGNPGNTRLVVDGGGELVLTNESNGYTGGTQVQANSTLTLGDQTWGNGKIAGTIGGVQSAKLNVFTASEVDFSNPVNLFLGEIDFNAPSGGTGIINLSGVSSNFSGAAAVHQGAVLNMANGTLGGDLVVNPSAILSGTGTLGSVEIQTNGTLSPGDFGSPSDNQLQLHQSGAGRVGSLTFGPELLIAGNATMIFDVHVGNHDTVNVQGLFTAGGKLLVYYNGTDGTAYTLITYQSYSPNENFPGGISVYDTNKQAFLEDGQYEWSLHYNGTNTGVLIVQEKLDDQDYYWNGGSAGNQNPTGVINGSGGDGTWDINNSNRNWVSQQGTTPSIWENGRTAHFATRGGLVTVAATNISVAGIFFDTGGYTLTGNSIQLTPDGTRGETVPRIDVVGGSTATLDLVLNASSLRKTGGGTLVLTKSNTAITGTTSIEQGTLQLGTSGNSQPGSVAGAITGGGTLELYAGSSINFTNNITGLQGAFNIRTGSVTMSGNTNANLATTTSFYSTGTFTISASSTYGGGLNIVNGTLIVGNNGNVGQGGSLVSVQSNASLIVSNPFNVRGSLTLAGGSRNVFQNTSGVVNVAGFLSLGGSILNAGALSGSGVYVLYNYSNGVNGQFSSGSTLPSGSSIDYLTSNQVRLIVPGSNGMISQYWDGAGTTVNSLVGGNGIWNNSNRNWANSQGSIASETAWVNNSTAVAIFSGSQSGTVTVNGDLRVAGMDFQRDGYVLRSNGFGALTLTSVRGAPVSINVNGGTATIAVPLQGTPAGLTKTGSGMLVLSSANTYQGNTTISQGTLQLGGALGNGTVVGSISGGGTLAVYAQSGTGVSFNNNIDSLTGPFNITGPGRVDFDLNDSGYGGTTTVTNGTFNLRQDIGGTVNVFGGTLAGDNATIGGPVAIGNGSMAGRLSPGDASFSGNSYGILTINGDLTLAANATSVFGFSLAGQANAPASNDLVVVNGTINLGGSGFDVTINDDEYGDYTLFQYSQSYTGNFGANVSVKFDTTEVLQPSQYRICPINPSCRTTTTDTIFLTILNAPSGPGLYWDGGNTNPGDGTIVGGSGTWLPEAFPNDQSWTGQDGIKRHPWTDDYTAIFEGTLPGTVTVNTETSPGQYEPIKLGGMQFNTVNYDIVGGPDDVFAIDSEIIMYVEDGVTVTNNVAYQGTGQIHKDGPGLLAVAPYKFAGNWVIEKGTLQIGDDKFPGSLQQDADILDEGTIRFYRSSGYNKTVTGLGILQFSLSNLVTSPFTFNGDGSAFAGEIQVLRGTLQVQNAPGPALNGASLVVGGTDPLAPGDPSPAGLNVYSSMTISGEIDIGDRNDTLLGSQGSSLSISGIALLTASGDDDVDIGNVEGSIVDADIRGTLSAAGGDIRVGYADNTNVTMTASGQSGLVEAKGGSIVIGNGKNSMATSVSVSVQGGATLSAAEDIRIGGLSSGQPGMGTLNIGSPAGTPAPLAAPGNLSAQQLVFGGGTATLVFNHSGAQADDYDFDVKLAVDSSGDGQTISVLDGFTSFSGDGSAYTGDVDISGGTFNVKSTLAGNFNVTGGVLSGIGHLGSLNNMVTIGEPSGTPKSATLSPGDLSVNAPPAANYGTLNIVGDLYLDTTAVSLFDLGKAGSSNNPALGGPENDLVTVDRGLTAGGALDITVTGGYGYYTLFTADNLNNSEFDPQNITVLLNNTPTGRFQITYPGKKNVVLEVYDVPTYSDLYWNGITLQPSVPPQVVGGDGDWFVSYAHTNWLNPTFKKSFDWKSPNRAIFDGASGKVKINTVPNGQSEPIVVTGMQFNKSGYELTYTTSATTDALTLLTPNQNPPLNPGVPEVPVIAVDDSLATNGGWASIGVVLKGTDGMEKDGEGTLILTADNTYSGDTTISAGTLQLGDSSKGLDGSVQGLINVKTANSTTLAVQATGTPEMNNGLVGLGDFNISGPGSLTFSGEGGAFGGDLYVFGGGTLVVTGELAGETLLIGEGKGGSGQPDGSVTLTMGGRLKIDESISLAALQPLSPSEVAVLNFGAAATDVAAMTGEILVGTGQGSVSFNSTQSAMVFNHVSERVTPLILDNFRLIGTQGAINHISGTTVFQDVTASQFTETVTISGGVLVLEYGGGVFGEPTILGGPVTVQSGGTLAGAGNIVGQVTVMGQGVLENEQNLSSQNPYSLRVASPLAMDADSILRVYLDPAAVNANTPLFASASLSLPSSGMVEVDVNTVGGKTLGQGYYFLIDPITPYSGPQNILTLAPGSKPTYVITYANDSGLPGIYLHVTSGTASLGDYWNPTMNGSGASYGGDGTWTASGGTDWTNVPDNAAVVNFGGWDNSGVTAIFKGTGGNVTVDSVTDGQIQVAGFNFQAGPYVLTAANTADTLMLVGAAVTVNVDQAAGSATLAVPLHGTSGLIKQGPGELKFTARNSYDGGTAVQEGSLVFGDNAAVAGQISIANGAVLAVNATGTVTFTTSNVISDGGGSSATPAAFNIVAGTAEVNSSSTRFSGNTTAMNGGTLTGTGALGGTVTVQQGGTLKGTVQTGPLTTGDSLVLQAGSTLDVTLDPNAPNTTVPLFITGSLDVVSGIVDVHSTTGVAQDIQKGEYFLISYTSKPNGSDPTKLVPSSGNFKIVDVNHGVYLTAEEGVTAYWHPVQSSPADFGGPGNWTANSGSNWSDENGGNLGPWTAGATAIFKGDAADVAVDTSGGAAVEIGGMTFLVDGYVIKGLAGSDELTFTTAQSNISVTVGETPADSAISATVELPMTGAAGLVKDGPGELVLDAINTYNGGTHVLEGTLTTQQAGAVPGDIIVEQAAIWNWDASGPSAFHGNIEGAGTFNVNVPGSLQLTAANTFTGTTNLAANMTLNVTGSPGSESSAQLLGTINVGNKAILEGMGSFGAVRVGDKGKIRFGAYDNTGAMAVTTVSAESLDIVDGGSFEIAVDSNVPGSASLLNVSGAVTITGTVQGDVKLIGEPLPPAEYTVIAGGPGSSYSTQISAPAGTVTALYGFETDPQNQNNLLFTVKPNTTKDLCVQLSSDACDIVGTIKSLSSDRGFGALRNIRIDEAEEVLPQLSGDVYASSDAAMVAGSRYLRNATGEQVRGSLGGVSTGAGISAVSNYAAEPSPVATPFGAFEEDNGGIGVWAAGYGAWSSMDGSGVAAKMTDSVGGFFLGADAAAFGSMRFGAVAGFGQSTYKVDAHNAKGTSDDYTFGLYGGGEWGGFGVDFGTAYTWHSVSTNRSVYASTFTDHLSGSYDAGTFQVYGGVGYGFDVTDSFTLEPYADAAYINQHSDAFTETGGIAALSYQSQTMNTGFTTVGLRGAWEFDIGGYQNRLSASAGWRHGFGDLDPQAAFTFAGSDPFGVTGTPLAEDQAVLSIGWDTEFSDTVSVGVNYTGQFAGGNRSQNVTAKLNIRF